MTVQLYCDALDQYLYYLEQNAPAVCNNLTAACRQVRLIRKYPIQVTPKFVNSLVELITSSIDNISSPDVHPSSRAPPGLVEGVQTPDMITRHFRNTLLYIQSKKDALANSSEDAEEKVNQRWEEIDVVGATLKMGIAR